MSNVSQPQIRMMELDDIQLIRFWRNLPHIRDNMVFKDVIDQHAQRNWFSLLDPQISKYFVYSLGASDVGCVSLTSIDYHKGIFEGGIFCGDNSFSDHWINVWACLQIYDIGFTELQLESATATILKSNKGAINFNRALGFKWISDLSVDVSTYTLDSSTYFAKSERLRKFIKSVTTCE